MVDRNITEEDYKRSVALLGREPRTPFIVKSRCANGSPQTLVADPVFFEDNLWKPFPSFIWLVCPRLKAKVAELNSKLEAYETAAKEELVTKFSSKINDSEFLSEVRDNLSSYSVESLKSTLGAKLAEQVLVEETSEEERVNGMIYSFNGAASKETKKGWQELVRATKEAANRK